MGQRVHLVSSSFFQVGHPISYEGQARRTLLTNRHIDEKSLAIGSDIVAIDSYG